MYYHLIILSFLLIPNLHAEYLRYKGLNYGPYVAECSFFNITCPNCYNLSFSTSTVIKVKDNDVVQVNTTLYVEVQIDEIRISVYKINNSRDVLWSYKVRNPCHHFALGAMLKETYKVDDNCLVKKGSYFLKINYTNMVRSFFGPNFFYGTFFFKSSTLCKRQSIISVTATTKFRKKSTEYV